MASKEEAKEDVLFDENFDEGDEDESKNVVELLKQCLFNERAAPELLVFEADIVQAAKQALEAHTESLVEARDNVQAEDDNHNTFQFSLFQMDIDRVTYLLNAYLRTRLKKIEKFVLYILQDQDDRLSTDEYKFAEGYLNLTEEHFIKSFLQFIPDKFRELTDNDKLVDMVPRPSLQQHVFLRVNTDVPAFPLTEDGEQEVDLAKGDVFAASYFVFKDLLAEDKIALI
mmetsp:Transcript_30071/g.41954  ORF Transcript_30071/g.41954 Transcript_30071/m.41954 type:complete len:228 (-) Transcript_30071:175-858(-)